MSALGRPTSFSEELAFKICALAGTGCTNEEIAEQCGIAPSSLYIYLKKYPDFSEAMKANKRIADAMVEGALFRRALGYEQRVTKIVYDKDIGKFATHDYIERLPPDPTCIQMWLRNRKSEDWTKDQNPNPFSDVKPIRVSYDRNKLIEIPNAQSQNTIDVEPIKNTGANLDGKGKDQGNRGTD